MVLSGWLPKGKVVRERLAVLMMIPVPVKDTVWVLFATRLLLSVTVKVPVSGPPTVGAKVTLMVQVALIARLVPQLLVWPKLALAAMLLMASAAVPVLLKVTGWYALVVSKFWLPNGSVLGDSPAEGDTVEVGSFDTKTVTLPELHPPQVL